MRLTWVRFAAFCGVFLLGTAASQAEVLLVEDFEGLSMQPYVSPTESGGDGTDWTDQLPAGWTASFFGPVGNPIEFQGWRIHDVDSWIATEGNQERATWTQGGVGQRGSVLVVDPDAYDDGTDIAVENMFATVTSPPIDLSTLEPGSVTISFDSFFRNEVPSDLSLDVNYTNGSGSSNLVYYDSDLIPDGAVFDDRLSFNVNNPGTGTMTFTWSLIFGDNDWWWAIDNVQVEGTVRSVPEPATGILLLTCLTATALRLRRRSL
jgi:hypothetical protein